MSPDARITTTAGVRTPMSVESLISTIRRHVPLFREDPDFADYIVKLALYLLEVNSTEDEPPEDKLRRRQTVGRLLPAERKTASETCQVCGSPTEGKRVCPHCHHMVG